MFLIYKIFLVFLCVYYVTFCGAICYTSIIEDWCCSHLDFFNSLSTRWYNCINCIKNLRCTSYQRLHTDDVENYETARENIEIEI